MYFFYFKQKTAYELRISDWSSDVCSSDLYQWSFGTAFHAWIPNEQDMDWLSRKYPDTFDRYYRPRWEHIKKMAASGTPYANYGLAKLCQTYQLPAVFSETGDPPRRSEDHTSELTSLMRISYAVFCL